MQLIATACNRNKLNRILTMLSWRRRRRQQRRHRFSLPTNNKVICCFTKRLQTKLFMSVVCFFWYRKNTPKNCDFHLHVTKVLFSIEIQFYTAKYLYDKHASNLFFSWSNFHTPKFKHNTKKNNVTNSRTKKKYPKHLSNYLLVIY